MLEVNSQCKNIFLIVLGKFPVISVSEKNEDPNSVFRGRDNLVDIADISKIILSVKQSKKLYYCSTCLQVDVITSSQYKIKPIFGVKNTFKGQHTLSYKPKI